jgi:four helix bundle protein
MKSYQELLAWQRGMDFVAEIYQATADFPKTEMFGLTNQMRRAAVSVPANIAEGYCRQSRQEYIRFLRIAFASGGELETHLGIAERLGFLDKGKYDELIALLSIIMKMLNRLSQSLMSKSQSPIPSA